MARILCIDDDEDILVMLHRTVSQSGHVVEEAIGTQEALAMVKDIEYDLILLDLNMPNYDGYDFLKLYRSTYPERNTPIVVVSGDKAEDAYARAVNYGANDFLAKPIQNNLSLLRIIEKFCGRLAA